MTSTQIRQSFLDFFKSKQHTIVPSSSLMPDSPNLLFTNAGMNQFVPIFLDQTQCPYTPGRAADTQKCIRAGGKHNDLNDVGLDTYHHTFFEMLGNWSFGDYFKAEAIDWAWELVVEIWKFPPTRVYATVYNPDKSQNDPSNFDQEAWNYWAGKFRSAGLDPAIHIVNGNKKDNFWMMGDTGPCGPCSELHIDLTPDGDTKGSLVNKGDARCIEIWNLVFIQFNAEPDGPEEAAKMSLPNAKAGETWRQRFVPLPAKHVDTGMGFERVTSIIQGTKSFKDFATAKISNYETDIFRPIFDALEKLSGKKYTSTLPTNNVGQASRLPSERSSASIETPLKTSGECPTSNIIEVPSTSPHPGRASDEDAELAPGSKSPVNTEQIQIDIAFRVIADHIRTLSFAIADGIQPGNTDRNYVLRRILRRAVRYGRTLGFHEPFFYKLVDILADTMGDVFPEIRAKKKHVQDVIRVEEEAFNKTLDSGIEVFESVLARQQELIDVCGKILPQIESFNHKASAALEGGVRVKSFIQSEEKVLEAIHAETRRLIHQDFFKFFGMDPSHTENLAKHLNRFRHDVEPLGDIITASDKSTWDNVNIVSKDLFATTKKQIKHGTEYPGRAAFVLHDTYGFPLDLTELMARERGLTVDKEGFNKLMAEQKKRSEEARVTQVIELSQVKTTTPTKFVGYENLATDAKVLEVVSLKDKTALILDTSTCYAEMGGQVGDTGELSGSGQLWRITNTQKSGDTWLHFIGEEAGNVGQASRLPGERFSASSQPSPTSSSQAGETPTLPLPGSSVSLSVDRSRRHAIERHHTVTHLLHWALHEVASKDASQKGSSVAPDKLTFDFNSAPLTPQQIADIEKLVNERIVENAPVSWTEVKHKHVKDRKDVMQFFGDKYGEWVRVVQIGGKPTALDGYSMELCGGTHTRATGEIGLFRIIGESAIAAGVRRIEAVAGLEAYGLANSQQQLIRTIAGKINSPLHELEKKVDLLLAHQKELEKSLKAAQQREAAGSAKDLVARAETINGTPAIIANLGANDGDTLQSVADALKSQFKGVVVLGGSANGAVTLIASVSPDFTAKVQAGKIIQQIAPIVGGKGGGKPDNARGGGKDASKLDEALAKAKSLLG